MSGAVPASFRRRFVGACPARFPVDCSSDVEMRLNPVVTLSNHLERLLGCNVSEVYLDMLGALASNPSSHSLSLLSARLAAGAHSRIRLVGGSITYGTGATAHATGGSVAQGFTGVFEEALRTAWPGASLEVEVHAGGGLGSRYYGSCLEDIVPRKADLVVLDVSINDIEGLVQAREVAFNTVIDQLEYLDVASTLVFNWAASPIRRRFGSLHYIRRHGLAVAGNTLIAAAAAQTRPNLSAVTPLSLVGSCSRSVDVWDEAGLHPSYFGHQLIGLYLALLIAFAGNEAFEQAAGAAARTRNVTAGASVAPKLHVGKSVCFTGDKLAKVRSTGSLGAGWNWTDEGRGKWGYVGTSASGTFSLALGTGAALLLTDTLAREQLRGFFDGSIRSHAGSVSFWVELGYLKSYGREYGTILLACEPCRCSMVRSWWPYPVVDTREQASYTSVWASTIFQASCQAGLAVKSFRLVVGQNVSGKAALAGGTGSKVKVIGVKLHPPDGLLQ